MAGTAPVQWVSNKVGVGRGGSQGALDTFTVDHAHGLLNLVGSRVTGPVPLAVRLDQQASPVAETAADASGFGYVVTNASPYNVPIPVPSGFALSASGDSFFARSCIACGSDQWNILYGPSSGSGSPQSSTDSLPGLASLVTEPLGEFLLTTRYVNGTAFNHSFALDPVSNEPSLVQAGSITMDNASLQSVSTSGLLAFSVDPFGGNYAVAYRIMNDGAMLPLDVSSFQGSKIVLDPTGRFAFALNAIGALDPETGPGKIYVYSVDSETGGLSAVSGPTITPQTPRDAAMSADGKYFYVANGGFISVFQFEPDTGALAEVPFSPITVGTSHSPLAVALAVDSNHQ